VSWYPTLILWMGLGEASLLMVGAIGSAFALMLGLNFEKIAENWFPALAVLVIGNVAAAIILAATHWLLSL
jgi:hypothetical protein